MGTMQKPMEPTKGSLGTPITHTMAVVSGLEKNEKKIKLKSKTLERKIIMTLSVSTGRRRGRLHGVFKRNLVSGKICSLV